MTDHEKRMNLFDKIRRGSLTKDEAIAEYMKLGESLKDAEGLYQEIRSEAAKARLGLP